MARGFYERCGKRGLDLALTVPLLVLLFPILLILALIVRLRLGAPVLFQQTRPGLHAQPFVLLKFRTMIDLVEPDGRPAPDSARLTALGRLLRRTSLDELPELWNVLKGQMSLVGPRPLLMRYLPRYTPHQMRRHEVRPGITGLAQVSGRNALSWDEKFALDVRYVDELSLALDLAILFRTFWNVLTQKGISQAGHATMREFGIDQTAERRES
jgi:lipopolysaccharide/colanic/teichoic acid biosynthesis glycosyltransferase